MAHPTPNSFQTAEEFLQGAVLLIDKPMGWTSFDALNKIKSVVRHHMGNPKFKIGHAGTLDPLATGLLVVCTGKYTKIIEQLQGGTKEYTGTFYIGKTTPSFDLETEPEGDFFTEHITPQLIAETAASFVGDQMQQPPLFSAKQVDGKRAYVSARKGEHVDIPKVAIRIEACDITRNEMPELDFRIRCSKGTYIRTIANDFGQRMNSGSYLKSLRRTVSEPYSVESSYTLDDLLNKLMAFGAKNEI